MTALEDARAALVAGELNAEMGVPVTWGEVRALHDVIRALMAEYERVIAATNPRKTIAQISAYEASVSIRAREVVDARKVFEAVTAPPTDDERAQAGLDSERLRQIAEWLSMEHGHEETAKRVALIADRHDRLAAGFRRQGPITDEWEWGAIWTNGVVEGKWFDMGDSFPIREAAERQVDGYVDPQIVLGRRRKAGPWEPVEAARDA